MKCDYRKARARKELDRRYLMYGTAYLEYIDVCIGLRLAEKDGWRRERLQRFFDTARDSTMATIEKYKPDFARVKDPRRGVRKMVEGELVYDAMETALFAMTKELCECGLDFDVSRLRGAMLDREEPKPGHDRNVWTIRRQWYESSGRIAGDVYIAGALLYFREAYGYGAERLRRIWEPLVEDVVRYFDVFWRIEDSPRATGGLRQWTDFDDEGGQIGKMISEKQQALTKYGIKLIEVNDGERDVVVEGVRCTKNADRTT